MNLFDPWCQTSKWSEGERKNKGPKGQLPVWNKEPSVLDYYDPFYSCPSFLRTLKTYRKREGEQHPPTFPPLLCIGKWCTVAVTAATVTTAAFAVSKSRKVDFFLSFFLPLVGQASQVRY